jgi:hypothetical protein
MGIKDFQNFIEKDPVLSKVGVNGIDLVKTAWKMNKGKGQVMEISNVVNLSFLIDPFLSVIIWIIFIFF